jgi:hypothetical protein
MYIYRVAYVIRQYLLPFSGGKGDESGGRQLEAASATAFDAHMHSFVASDGLKIQGRYGGRDGYAGVIRVDLGDFVDDLRLLDAMNASGEYA